MFPNNMCPTFVFVVISLVLPMCLSRTPPLGKFPDKIHEIRHEKAQKRPVCAVLNNWAFRNGMTPEYFRWKDFNVHLDPSFDEKDQAIISQALSKLREVLPCLNFTLHPANSPQSGDFVQIVPGDYGVCWSKLGRQGGKQLLTLGEGCVDYVVVLHELIHALGLHHEQCRCDRDDHITVLFENMEPGAEWQFQKVCEKDGFSTFGVPYNTKSIMHYASEFFSKNGNPVILTKEGERIGAPEDIQDTDVQKLQAMYNCGTRKH